jgi:hypothetical protein
MKKYVEKQMVLVMSALAQTGLMTAEELTDYLIEEVKTVEFGETREEAMSNVAICLDRWKAKKALVIDASGDAPRYKPADVPVWFSSLQMMHFMKVTNAEAKETVKKLSEFYEQGTNAQPNKNRWTNFKRVELTFEAVDELLGGSSNYDDMPEKSHLYFPKNAKGEYFIPTSWQKGWIRSNAPLINAPGSMQEHVGIQPGTFMEQPKMTMVKAFVNTPRGSVGEVVYEACPAGTVFKTVWEFPMIGSNIKSIDHLKEFLEGAGMTPIKGLAPNPNVRGGRIRLVEIKEVPRFSFLS